MARPLVLVSGRTKGEQRDPGDDSAPRKDYFEIARRLDGDVIGYDLSDGFWYGKARQLETRLKLDFVEAFIALQPASQHNLVVSLSERIAIPLGMMLQVTRKRIPHVVIGHKLSSGLKLHLFRHLHVQETFSHLVCVSEIQAEFAVNELHIPRARVSSALNPVDERFFHPLDTDTEDFILAVGSEQRDYETLGRAVAGTGKKLVVFASGFWNSGDVPLRHISEVQMMKRVSYTELRDYYARARLVVVPLHKVDYAAGVNALQEAMAMGKPTIVTRTPGIGEYVMENETAVYVTPGDAKALREIMVGLWDDAQERSRLGANARRAVEERMGLDQYVDHIVQVTKELSTS